MMLVIVYEVCGSFIDGTPFYLLESGLRHYELD
jgi:hypothetical protein